MTQHFTRNTTSVRAWCNTCQRHTMHRVTDRRMGSCMEHGGGTSKKQERQQKERELAAQHAEFQF